MGRYPTILLSLLELMIFGFGTAFVSSFNQYIFFRFCVSQAVVGYAISSSALREAGRWGGIFQASVLEWVAIAFSNCSVA